MERAGELPLDRSGYVRVAHGEADLVRFTRRPPAAGAGRRRRARHRRRGARTGRAGHARRGPRRRIALPERRPPRRPLAVRRLSRASARRRCGADGRARVEAIELGTGGATVVTDDERLDCDVVVNAAGAWAARIAALAGVELALVNQRHEIALVHLSAPMDPPIPMVNTYVPGSAREGLYFRSEGTRMLLAGAHSYEIMERHTVADPDTYQRQVSFDFLEQIAEGLSERLPTWPDLRLEPGWTGSTRRARTRCRRSDRTAARRGSFGRRAERRRTHDLGCRRAAGRRVDPSTTRAAPSTSPRRCCPTGRRSSAPGGGHR